MEKPNSGLKTGILFLIAVFLFFIYVAISAMSGKHTGSPHSTEPVTEPASRPVIAESERILIPDPEYFLGVEELVFEEFPDAAMNAYYDLMTEKYGFTLKYPEFSISDTNYLTYDETGNYDVWILPFRRPDGLIYIGFHIPDTCRTEALETWDGEILHYLYDPEHWTACAVCDGTGRCYTCDGRGWIDTGSGYDINKTTCNTCGGNKKCTDCWEGQIKLTAEQDDWNRLTDAEKADRDFRRYSEEVFGRSK